VFQNLRSTNTLGSKFSFKRYAKTSAWWVIEIDAARAVPKKKEKKKREKGEGRDSAIVAKQKWREFEGIISRNWDPSQRKQRYVSPLPRKLIRPNFTRLHYIRPLPPSLSFSKMQEGRKAQKISLRSSIRSERVYCFARVDDFSSTRYGTRWLVPLGYRFPGGISCFAGRGRRVFANLREMTESRGKAIADKFDDCKN